MTTIFNRLKRGYGVLKRKFSESIVIQHITSEGVDSHGVIQTTTTSTSTTAVVHTSEDSFIKNKAGDYEAGDYEFLLSPNETIATRDFIVYSSNTYQVQKVEKITTSDGEVGIVAVCQLT